MRSKPTMAVSTSLLPVNKNNDDKSPTYQKLRTKSPQKVDIKGGDFKCRQVQQPQFVASSTQLKADLSASQSKYKFHGLMFPRHDILKHPAANTLLQYATEGCPVDCGDN